jgi:hypothetical protein
VNEGGQDGQMAPACCVALQKMGGYIIFLIELSVSGKGPHVFHASLPQNPDPDGPKVERGEKDVYWQQLDGMMRSPSRRHHLKLSLPMFRNLV